MVYIPPEGSPFENKDVFTELENSLLLLEHDGVCFLGDFNARTGAVDGIITDGFNHDFDMPHKVCDDALGSDKIPSALPKGYHRTWLLTITVLDSWILAKRLMLLLSMGVLDQTPLLGNVHVKMSVLLITPWCRRICFH